MKYLIVSGGEVKEGFLTWIVKNGGFDVILAADAGMEALYRDHILPDIIVGEFDSVNPDTLEYFHDKEQIEVCMLNPEKDDTDTEYAIREAIRRGAMEIVVIGATGTRIDHVLGNISLLGIGLEEQIKISLVDERVGHIEQLVVSVSLFLTGKCHFLFTFSYDNKFCFNSHRAPRYTVFIYSIWRERHHGHSLFLSTKTNH